MRLLIPFASALSPACTNAWNALKLPHFDRLMRRMRLVATDQGDEYSFSPPHERFLAKQLGIWSGDGQAPWAAWHLQASAGHTGYRSAEAWAQVTPCHWRVGVDQIQMAPIDDLQLSEADSRALFDAMQPYFQEDGITLHFDSPTRWWARADVFAGLSCASLCRVHGRNVNAWMSEGTQAAPLRRLQNEMQMLLYTHCVNERRINLGLHPVNSFWVSDAGALPAAPLATSPAWDLLDDLSRPALREDWAAWAQAWRTLDDTLLHAALEQAVQGQRVDLVVCGERHAQHWSTHQVGFLPRFLREIGLLPILYMREQL